MKQRLYVLIMLIFSGLSMPLNARKCCKIKVAQSQLGCINSTLEQILNKVCALIVIETNDCSLNFKKIAQSDIPKVINEPGHYCLQDNVTNATTAITISSDDVFLDLQGYSIDSQGVGANGISIGAVDSVVITNGIVESSTGAGIISTGAKNVVFNEVLSRNNGDEGFRLATGNSCMKFVDCTASNNTVGFASVIGNSNITYLRSIACTNTTDGFLLAGGSQTLDTCMSYGNTSNGFHFLLDGFTLKNSRAYGNGTDGISLENASNGSIEHSTSEGNIGNGINGLGSTSSVSIFQNVITNNTGVGIILRTPATDPVPTGTTTNCQVIENKVVNNGKSLSTTGGIDVGGLARVPGASAANVLSVSHAVISNVAQFNGNSPNAVGASAARDTNYSRDVVGSSNTAADKDNGLVVPVSGTVVRLTNLTI